MAANTSQHPTTARMNIAERFIREHGPRNAPEAFARALMAGDPASFKVGYTADNAYLVCLDAFDMSSDAQNLLAEAIGVGEHAKPEPMEMCGCGATKPSECCAAVEHYYTSLGQRSDEELVVLAEGDGCTAAKAMLDERNWPAPLVDALARERGEDSAWVLKRARHLAVWRDDLNAREALDLAQREARSRPDA